MRIQPLALALALILLVPAPSGAKGKDSDGDGVPDRWERGHRTNPNEADGYKDPDYDELNNLQEFKARTHPRRYDTDSDRLSDGDEVRKHESDPRVFDTDNDGLEDFPEAYPNAYAEVYLPDDYGTDINDPDSDDDGTLDGDEDADDDGIANEDEDDLFKCLEAQHDPDEDGVNNEDENEQGNKKHVFDTDLDGVSDGKEDADDGDVLNEDEGDVDPADCLAWQPVAASLGNAATAEESFLTQNNTYTDNVEDLFNEGLKLAEDIVLTIPRADEVTYCVEARHEEASLVMSIRQEDGLPKEGTC
jgi:hypothetical protein